MQAVQDELLKNTMQGGDTVTVQERVAEVELDYYNEPEVDDVIVFPAPTVTPSTAEPLVTELTEPTPITSEIVDFDVYRTSTEKKVGNLVTDAEGTAVLELPLGRYYLMETAIAPEYSLLSGKASFSLTEVGATVEIPIMNRKESCKPEGGHIRLVKSDADTSDTLTGAIFGIYQATTNKYAGEIATGSDGTATSLMFPTRDYYIAELRAPEGCETDATQHPVTVTADGMVEITVTNKKLPETPTKPEPEVKTGTVKIIKTDADDSNKKLSDASFSIYETVSGKRWANFSQARMTPLS